MPLQNPRDFFVYGLSSMHSAEQSIVQQLGQMEQRCQNPQIKQLLSNHITETQRQVSRIEECCRVMGVQLMNVPNHTISCKAQDWQSFIQQNPSQEFIDMYSLGAAFNTEHYEIASYTSLINMARWMGESQVASLLEDTLREEQSAAQAVEQLGTRVGAQMMQRARP